VHGAHPLRRLRRQPRVAGRLAAPDRVQVGRVEPEPPAELRGVPDVPVARDHLTHAGHRGQPPHAREVVTERIRRQGVKQRYLDVGAHVARDQDPAIGQEHCPVAGGVPVMDDQPGLRPVPRDCVGVQSTDLPDEREVEAEAVPPCHLQDAVPLGLGNGYRGGCGVPGCVAELAAPYQVVPVRMGRPGHRGPEPQRAEFGHELRQLSRGHARVDEQAFT
jgi:hypothetical protein